MMLWTLHLTAVLAVYIVGRLHERRIARKRRRTWANGSALQEYPKPELPLDFEAMARRTTIND